MIRENSGHWSANYSDSDQAWLVFPKIYDDPFTMLVEGKIFVQPLNHQDQLSPTKAKEITCDLINFKNSFQLFESPNF
jgi:hypothetical protein